MQSDGTSPRTYLPELTTDELRIISNALNEVCNGIDLDGEFETRMGVPRERVLVLLSDIQAAIGELGRLE
jgi:hypothetical protein